jgi:hypothetical protein
MATRDLPCLFGLDRSLSSQQINTPLQLVVDNFYGGIITYGLFLAYTLGYILYIHVCVRVCMYQSITYSFIHVYVHVFLYLLYVTYTSRCGDNRASGCPCLGIICACRHSAAIMSSLNWTRSFKYVCKCKKICLWRSRKHLCMCKKRCL